MSHHIPNDILIEILAHLPVKSLLRFTAVCKHWHSVITNPNFIPTHLNSFGKTSTDQLLVRMFGYNEFLLLPNNENFEKNYLELIFPRKVYPEVGQSLRIVGTLNGLICLYSTDTDFEVPKSIIIWNPCIRKSVTLPTPKTSPNIFHVVIGFGFDLVKNIFKVVRIIYGRESINIHVPPEVEVHDQGGSEWKLIGRAPQHYTKIRLDYTSQVFFNGAVHWVAENRDVNSIVAFKFGDDVFREIALPQGLPRVFGLSISLFKGYVAVFGSRGRYVWPSNIDECYVWMMRDYGVSESWINLYNIILPTGINRPLGLRKNGEILFASTKEETIISLDPGTKIITKSGIRGQVASWTVLNFVESLVLLA